MICLVGMPAARNILSSGATEMVIASSSWRKMASFWSFIVAIWSDSSSAASSASSASRAIWSRSAAVSASAVATKSIGAPAPPLSIARPVPPLSRRSVNDATCARAASRSFMVPRRVDWITSIPVSSSRRRVSLSRSSDCITEIWVRAALNRSWAACASAARESRWPARSFSRA